MKPFLMRSTTMTPGFKRYGWISAVLWTALVVASLGWNVFQVKKETVETACLQARCAFGKDVIYRRWNAMLGGVYVTVTARTPPNPYLANVPERDLQTPSGKRLTLMNPAYMTRQAFELGRQEYGTLAHITSLKPVRPENAPDPWEIKALQAFERGESEIHSVETLDGQNYLRLMRPLITEKSCLLCHAQQGYTENDICGGISVAVPMQPLLAISKVTMTRLALILLDIQLPIMDGYAVARELRQNGELGNIPIVAVTSYAMSGDRERVLAAGCTGYIEKPINPETFTAEIEKHLLYPKNKLHRGDVP